LKPLQSADINTLNQYARNPKQFSGWKLWIVVLIILAIIIGYFVWRHYKEKTRQSCVPDTLIDILDGGKNNG